MDGAHQITQAPGKNRRRGNLIWQDERSRATLTWQDERSRATLTWQDERSRATLTWQDERSRATLTWQDERSRATLSPLSTRKFKRPESVLVVVYTRTGKVLLLKRADDPDFWQSVTGSLLWEETEPQQAAVRELREEAGLKATNGLRDSNPTFWSPILPNWRHLYAPELQENTEYAFALELPVEIKGEGVFGVF